MLSWNADTARIEAGHSTGTGPELQLRGDTLGRAIITLPMQKVSANDYPFLQLSFAHPPANDTILVLWSTAQAPEQELYYRIPGAIGNSLWLPTADMENWTGDIKSLSLLLFIDPGQEITLKQIALHPSSLTNQLKAFFSDWSNYNPWQHNSINFHNGIRSTSLVFYPVPAIATILALSLVAYALFLFGLRQNMRFDWRVVAAIFLVGWISLDLIWQGKLLQQLATTHADFAGKTTQDKLASGLDRDLVGFITQMKQRLETTDTRIFVASEDDYLGMRSAYYLYPLNVYWQRKGAELPQQKYFHSGDYIVLVKPTKLNFDTLKNQLILPGSVALQAEQVFTLNKGSLLRVK